jgi:RNA polymerase sigma-70 factor (ECF subfamily)
LIVGLAQNGDREAFAELVRRRQSPVRNLMRRCCREADLADDLAQQVFLQVWLKLRTLKHPEAFGAWLKRLAISIWLQQLRKKDALRNSAELDGFEAGLAEAPGMSMDLDDALATLPETMRLCVVLSYQEGMSHREIAAATGLPLGTIKSCISRGSERLRQRLSTYGEPRETEMQS